MSRRPPPDPLRRPAEFRRALREWYHRNARPLPWRTSPSLYRTVVSEFMLQQTQVKTVLPYFDRWLRAFPDFAALAAAPEEQVLRHWEGLGYYSRARNLHRLARELASCPKPPDTAAGWRELPGIGPYTAAAIASIALGEPAACVDGNVVRILARLRADPTRHRDSASAAKAYASTAAALLDPAKPGDHNQAMMELGATVCLRHAPRCELCPVRRFCVAHQLGRAADFPRLAPREIERRNVTRVWCENAGALLLHQAPAGARRFALIHELPLPAHVGLDDNAAARGPLLAVRRRTITRYQITESIHRAVLPRRARQGSELAWVPLHQLEAITLSGPHRRWIREILAGGGRSTDQ